MITANSSARRAARSRTALPALIASVALVAASVGVGAAPASASVLSAEEDISAQASTAGAGPSDAHVETPAVEAPAFEVPVVEGPVVEVPVVEGPVAEGPVAEVPAAEVAAAEASVPEAEPSAPISPSESAILATAVNMQSYSGGTVTIVTPGQTFEQGNTIRNMGPVGVPANAARLHFRADNGLIIASSNLRNVGVNGTRTRACTPGEGGATLECVTQSNWNPIGASTTGNSYSNFYTSVRIPADAIPGTTYALHYSFDFDSAVYENTNRLTSATWYYRVAVPAPVIETSPQPVGPNATIVGTGVPGATVYLSQYNGAALGTAVVGEDGRWSIIPSIPFVDGVNMVSAYQHSVDADSIQSGVVFNVDAQVDPPTVAGPEGEQDLSEPVELVGTGEPGATIVVRDEAGTVVCSTTVEVDGTWTCVIPALEDRDQELSVTQTDRVGNVSTPVAVSIHKTSAPGPQPGDGSTPEVGPQPASGAAADPISPSDASAPLTAPARAAELAATGGEIDGILLGAGGLLLVAGILSLAIPRRRVQ
ncbi:Ig-like domain-containing protein [Microbacterium sp. WCS2018Hpa-23]|uniref:Ig-like domain-containing protein n=1 Tax=Microbacterium sp. WCS2018Hpa-23 TaxID=3073634 RepID=UPI002882F993|nr:Ig-like domain-containing protein [Microbacterium sp. WCS2018Hpa-23]